MTASNAGDRRRATALVCHFGHRNIDGYNAVIQQAQESKRLTGLLWEILALHHEVVPILLTDDGLACATQAIRDVATIPIADDEDPGIGDCRRAALLTFAFAQEDIGGYNSVVNEAVELKRSNELFLALLELYKTVVPQLYTALGLTVLGKSVLDWAAREDDDPEDKAS